MTESRPPSAFHRLLIANRGEIAIRIARAARDLGSVCVAVYPADDAQSLHVQMADEAVALTGAGPAAYLDIEQIVAVALAANCQAIHPGYGFLSENAAFAARCDEAGIVFVGPPVRLLRLFGDKVAARDAALRADVPVLPGTTHAVSLEEARAFLASLAGGPAIIKAVAGGGGRGVRIVQNEDALADAYARCQSEANAAFGNGDVYIEQFMPRARHIEVQIVGDGSGTVTHLGERDCSVQRRQQKIVEVAPAPALEPGLRERIIAAAVRFAAAERYSNLGTFEFLVATDGSDDAQFAFIEANARLQVEHTVTEQVTGIDLVRAQLQLAAGAQLAQLNLLQQDIPAPRGYALQLRVNMETMLPDGSTKPTGGELTAFAPPAGPDVRVDTFGYAGYRTSPRYDSLLAKVIVHTPRADFGECIGRAYRALAEFRIEGVATNLVFLQNVLQHAAFVDYRVDTQFIDTHVAALVAEGGHRELFVRPVAGAAAVGAAARAGAKVDAHDPLAVLTFGQQQNPSRREAARRLDGDDAVASASGATGGTVALAAPLQGTVVSIDVRAGDLARVGQLLLVMESMKMEHEVRAVASGAVLRLNVVVGDVVYEGHPLLYIEPAQVEAQAEDVEQAVDLDEVRPDLRQVLDRRATIYDAARPAAVARRRAKGQRTARENVDDLCDPGTFVEYAPLVLAAQARRRSLAELIEKSPTDGMITGVGAINGALFDETTARCAVLAYDYTVFAGTQGGRNHAKTDRMIHIAEQARLPLVLFAEGGGGRPGDTEGGDGQRTFARFPQLSGLVPMVGITSGRCFAGNASLLACCDVIIATADANIGMGGPAMIEGGGLGVFAPEDIGPMDMQVANGVVDLAVKDEADAVRVAKRYLAYFQGALKTWQAPDQRVMRRIIPENRLRVYNVRDVVETLADVGSVLELRRDFGVGMIAALVRIEGRPLGIIANNPMHLGGAIDSDAADKGARFMQLLDAFDIPLLCLCDTPGIMVGPEVERTALVRHANRMFLIGTNITVPFFTVVLRKAYGLGGIAMSAGSYKSTLFTVAWPTAEFGGMGLEGSVKLGYRAELAAISDADERKALFDKMVAQAYERGKALNQSAVFAVDDTIDPAETRHWVVNMLKSVKPPPHRAGKKRPWIDAW